jgi:type III secretion protein J
MARVAKWFAVLGILLALAGCKVELYGSLSEREANEMLALLLRNGIDSAKVPVADGRMALHVEERMVARAIEVLKQSGYPRESFTSIGDVFRKEGLISSPLEERVRFVYALSQELSGTISQIDGVLSARVHVVLPNNEFASENAVPSSAAVFIRHQSDYALETLIPQIKMLVTNSIEGLTYEKVSVVLFPVDLPNGRSSEIDFEQVLSVRVHPSSVGSFWLVVGILGGIAALALAGNAGLFYLWRRQSTQRGQVPAAGNAD